ncbi:MAG TPA: twin-arginine translocase TatA/TatE family subunit [Acidobacteriota bacterium]|nr:twin-arginine translocase TatA/TatE family subunit [Acidobacteriota bacterium]
MLDFIMGNLGFPELLVILVIAVFVFGAGKLPEVGRGLGQAIRSFKEGLSEASREDDQKK